MLRSDSAFEVAVFPRMVEMVVRIGATGVMSHPVVIFRMNMGSFRVVRLIVEFPVIILRGCGMTSGSTHRSRTMLRDVTIPDSVLATSRLTTSSLAACLRVVTSSLRVVLSKERERNEQDQRDY